MLSPKLQSDLAIYSAKSLSANQQTIFALANCYLNSCVAGRVDKGALVFSLNTFELDRESFKLAQQLALLKITEDRLDNAYLDELIFKPLDAAIELATSDASAAQAELVEMQERLKAGQVTRVDVVQAEVRLHERNVIIQKATLDRAQRGFETDLQKKRCSAQKDDLLKRLELNDQIREIHTFAMPFAGTVSLHTYAGAFLEKGDPICTVSS
jgi:hypothetical protein